jgi:DNA-binding NarL/FixJ family response regulator
MSYTIRLLLADDHPLYLDALQQLLKQNPALEVAGVAANGLELLDLAERVQPEVVLTDIQMPELDGIAATRQLRRQYPALKILALTMYQENSLILDMLEAGANGYLLKSSITTPELLQAIESVHQGHYYFCNQTNLYLSKLIAASPIRQRQGSQALFTEKELDVMRLICEQHSTKQIAHLMQLTPRTVEKYRDRIMNKTGAHNVVGIAIYAIQHSIFEVRNDGKP